MPPPASRCSAAALRTRHNQLWKARRLTAGRFLHILFFFAARSHGNGSAAARFAVLGGFAANPPESAWEARRAKACFATLCAQCKACALPACRSSLPKILFQSFWQSAKVVAIPAYWTCCAVENLRRKPLCVYYTRTRRRCQAQMKCKQKFFRRAGASSCARPATDAA